MNRHIYLLLFIIALAGCTKHFDGYNTNPNQATNADLSNDFAGLGVFIPQMEENVVVADPQAGVAPYQTIQNLNADIFSGYNGTPTAFSGGSSNSQYNINGSWSNKAFENPYNNIMSAWLQVRTRAVNQPDFYALANIIKVAGMHRVTDIFGPIPYSGYGAGGFEVGYDSQTVYNAFFSELDSAIATLGNYVTANPGAMPAQNYDLVYKGNYVEWIKFANSLKLRLAMHIVYADPALAQSEAEAAISNSYGVMTVNTDNAFLSSSSTIVVYNPLYTIDVGFGDTRMGAVLQSFLTGYNDPRMTSYMLPASGFSSPYIGIRTGIDLSQGNYRQMSGINFQINSPIQWMTAAEVWFLRAEGALRGWNMGATSQYCYEQGIQTSFTQYSASGAAGYIANATSTAAPYTDPYNSKNNIPTGNPNLSTITIQWDNTAGFETNLERIITQKYIAMFPNGQEAWTEFRRTRYPRIWPVVENFSNGAINTQIQIRRLPYPPDEYNNNNKFVTQAVSTLGGPDNGGTKLWWDQKP